MDKLHIPSLKPRARHLHEVLMGRRGGTMKSAKQPTRQQLKREFKREIHDHR